VCGWVFDVGVGVVGLGCLGGCVCVNVNGTAIKVHGRLGRSTFASSMAPK
jgi:hypothetical protein